jgi:hypothetical protein
MQEWENVTRKQMERGGKADQRPSATLGLRRRFRRTPARYRFIREAGGWIACNESMGREEVEGFREAEKSENRGKKISS